MTKKQVVKTVRKALFSRKNSIRNLRVLVSIFMIVSIFASLIPARDPIKAAPLENTFAMPGTGEYLANFDDEGYDDGSGTTFVLSTEVKLDAQVDWWNVNWNYKKNVTLQNLSAETLAAGITAQITVDTQGLGAKVKSACEDLRLVYYDAGTETHTQITRSYYVAAGATNCSNSAGTIVSFPLYAELVGGASDANYFLYYGNSGATDPGFGDDGYNVDAASATLVAPFNQSTTGVDGETPSAATGAIRYSGGKSALGFDGNNDYVSVPNQPLKDGGVPFTIEAWVYLTKGSLIQQIIGDPWNGIRLYINEANKVCYAAPGLGDQCSTGGAVELQTWHHLAVSYDMTTLRLFDDGVQVYNVDGTFGVSQGLIYVGMDGVLDGRHLNGFIDELRVSDSARYTSGFSVPTTAFGSDADTLLLYHFDENGDDPRNTGKAIDSSGNANHGTITGAKYVSGLVGVDNSSTWTGNDPLQTLAGHQGVFIEEATTNKITNPSFDNGIYNTNWAAPYFNYSSSLDTYTANMAKRNSAGPFASGPMVQGNWASTVGRDSISYTGTQIAASFYTTYDCYRGTVVFWVTPEWNGNDGKTHHLWSGNYATQGVYKINNRLYLGRPNYTAWVSVDISSWTAGTTYLVVARWDSINTLDGTNYASITVNNTTTFGYTSPLELWASTTGFVGRSFNDNEGFPANAIIEGLTVYRRPLYDLTTSSGV